MAVRKFKPTTPGQRHKIIGTFEEITASVPEKSLVYGKKSSGGRNARGCTRADCLRIKYLQSIECWGCCAYRKLSEGY